MDAHTADNTPDIRNASVTAIKEHDTTAKPLGPDDPRVPFPSALKLTRKQEDALAALCMKRYGELDIELGRSLTETTAAQAGQEWHSGRGTFDAEDSRKRFESFMGRRLIFEMTYQNRMEWRKTIPNSVFQDCNLTLSTSRRICNQRIARFRRYFFEVRPWWAVQPVGPRNDKDFARKLLKIGDIKIHDSDSDSEFGQAVTRACVVGEGILHTHRAVDDDHYVEEIECLVDTNGEPIVAGDGDYITRDDTWMPAPQFMLSNPDSAAPVATAQPNHKLLARDPSTEKDITEAGGTVITTPMGVFVAQQFATMTVPRRAVHYQGARTALVYYRDFLCPLSATSIHAADCIVHIDRLARSEIAQRYAANPTADTIRQAVNLLNNALDNSQPSTNAPSGPRARRAHGEDATLFAPATDGLNVGHFYIKADPAATGITSDIYVLLDLDSQTPIYYHYTAACSPTRRRPYQCVRSEAVDGRWFGQGEMEKFANASNTMDLFLNTAALAQSRAGRVTSWRPERTLEGQGKPKLPLNRGGTITPIGDYKLEDCVETLELYDNKSNELKSTLEMLNQAATNESGTASGNDAAMAGLPTQKTATGNQLIQNAGNELTSLPVAVLRKGLTAALDDFIVTTFRFHDHSETFEILEGDVPVQLQLTKPETANLRVNVTIMLTSFYGEQRQQQVQQALVYAKDYRLLCMTDPEGAMILAPLYVDAMQATSTENAEDYIQPPTLMPVVPGAVPGSPPAQAAAPAGQPPPAANTPPMEAAA